MFHVFQWGQQLLTIVILFSWFSSVLGKVFTVDDLHSSISYDGCFPNNPSRPCGSCSDNPPFTAFYDSGWADCGNGASMTIRFTGTSISLFGATPKNDWDVTPIKITVDGGSARTFEGAGYKNPQQYRVQLASVTGLSKEQHTVQVSFFAKGSPGVTLFDYYTYDDGSDSQPSKPTTTANNDSGAKPTTTSPTTVPNTGETHTTEDTTGNTTEKDSPTTVLTVIEDNGSTHTVTRVGTASNTVTSSDTVQRTDTSTERAPSGAVRTITAAGIVQTVTDGRSSPTDSVTITPDSVNGSEQPASPSGAKANVVAIAASVIGVVILIFLILLFLFWRNQRKKRMQAPQAHGGSFTDISHFSSAHTLGLTATQGTMTMSESHHHTQPPGYASGVTPQPSSTLGAPAGETPLYSRADDNTESAQLAAWVSTHSDFITPDLAERLQVARYRPAYDPDMTSLSHWWDWFKVTPFEVGLLRTLYRETLDPETFSSATSDTWSASAITSPAPATVASTYSKSTDGLTRV